MTISSTNNRNNYVGNGATAIYSYTFKIFSNTDLRVTKRDTSNIETLLVLNTDYTVSGVGAAGGGSITLTAGNLPSGYHLTIRRVRPLKQETDIRNQGDFFPEIHEDEFDRQTMMHQQHQDELARSLKLPETSTLSEVTMDEGPGKFLKWNSGGTKIETSEVTGLGAFPLTEHKSDGTHDVISDLIVRAPKVDVRSLMDAATRAAWAVSPGTVDVATAIQAALTGGGDIFFIGKVFLSTAQLTIPSNTTIRGISNRLTTIRQGANFTTGSFLGGNGISNILMEDIAIDTQKATYAGTETALYINSSLAGSDVNLNRVFCNGSTSGGLAISNTTRARVSNCDVRDTVAADGIRIASCTDVIVDGNNVYEMTNLSTTKRGIQIGASNYVRASNNTVKGIPSTAFAFDFGGSSYVDMIGNNCQGGGGVDLEGASAAINIIGNSFLGGTAAGNVGVYLINGSVNIVNDVVIAGNTFLNLFHGVDVEGHRHIAIGNNIFRNMYGSAIRAHESGAVESDWITITGNNIDACSLSAASTYAALYIRAISGAVTGNVVRGGSTLYDIQDYSGNSNVQIENNIVGAAGYSDSQPYRKADLWSTSIFEGNGTPEGFVAAKVGSIFRRLDGGAGTTLYVKESGTGNTGWVGKGALGVWDNSKTHTTVYQAGTDLFVKAFGTNSSGLIGTITGYTDGANPPTVMCDQGQDGDASSGRVVNIGFHVRKGDYYKVSIANITSFVMMVIPIN